MLRRKKTIYITHIFNYFLSKIQKYFKKKMNSIILIIILFVSCSSNYQTEKLKSIIKIKFSRTFSRGMNFCFSTTVRLFKTFFCFCCALLSESNHPSWKHYYYYYYIKKLRSGLF